MYDTAAMQSSPVNLQEQIIANRTTYFIYLFIICWWLQYLSFDVSADLSVVSGTFSHKAEHRSEALFVIGALLEVTQTHKLLNQ